MFLGSAADASPGPSKHLDGAEPDPATLERVIVVSTRTPRAASGVVGMVSVIDDAEIEAQLAIDEEGLWRYTPSIEVESSGSRFPARGISIRGIGGNRVLMELDGIPIQDSFSVGSLGYGGRSGSELDFVRRIEVLRGPASSLYGSDAMGGVVAISTFDPGDLAMGPGRPGGRIRGTYAGETDSLGASVLNAWQGDDAGLLLGVSHRRGNEADRSAKPAESDRLDRDRSAVLAKTTLAGSGDARLRATLDWDLDEVESVLNSLAGEGRFASSTYLAGDDRVTRTGVALDGRAESGNFTLDGAVFYRKTRTRQDSIDLREALPRPVRIDRQFRYDTTISGARARASRDLEAAGLSHRLTAGIEYTRTRTDQSRDASITGLIDGDSSNVVLGERFPLRDIPLTTTHSAGAFFQDEIDWPSGRWSLIPSIRLDRTRIEVDEDETWQQANPHAELAELTETDWSPRLGALWRPSQSFQAWGQLATGFRAPPAEHLNIGLDIPLFRVRALPNPDLKSESSVGWELGLRANKHRAWFSAALFWTDYEDFIVPLVPIGVDPETGTLLFQAQNLDKARIRGVEFEAGAPLGLLSPRFESFSSGISGYWADGEDRRTGEDLDDVGPPSAVLYLDWASASGRWDARLSGLFSKSQTRGDDPDVWFRVPGHGVFDLTAAYRLSDRLTLRAGVFNLTDKTWWRWGETRRLPADDPLIPALSAPGRSLSVSFTLGLGPGRF